MLLVLVYEFESRRGMILNLFAKKKMEQLLRAPRVGEHNLTHVDEARMSWNRPAIKMQGMNRSGYGGRLACYMTPDLTYDWEGERIEAIGQ